MKQRIISEYDAVKNLKVMLHTFKLDTSIDVPIGVKRPMRRDDGTSDILSSSPYLQTNDPQVWPPPIPVEHNFSLRFYNDNIKLM